MALYWSPVCKHLPIWIVQIISSILTLLAAHMNLTFAESSCLTSALLQCKTFRRRRLCSDERHRSTRRDAASVDDRGGTFLRIGQEKSAGKLNFFKITHLSHLGIRIRIAEVWRFQE